jgi:DedD protein
MPSNSSPPAAPPGEAAKSPATRRLIAAAVLIGLAIGALALVDRFRERPAGLAPPHEPSQALITTPAPEPSAPGTGANQAASPAPPPPPLVLNNETLAPPRHAAGAMPPSSPVTGAAPVENAALVPGKAYMIQVGVFSSPTNAQALQKQLQHAGMEARLETRVQLGPFKDRRDADKALARAKKLGINAVIVSAR